MTSRPVPTDPAHVEVQLHVEPAPDLLARWDRLVTSATGTDVTQLSVWARVRALEGFRSTYLFAHRGCHLVGGAQVLLRHVRGLGEIGYVAYGPIVDSDDTAAAPALARALATLTGVRVLFVQPPEGGHDARRALLEHGFRPSSAGIAPTGSVRLDLTASEEDILSRWPARQRAWTRRWAREGVTVRQGDERDIDLLAQLMAAAADARGYARPPRPEYLRHLYDELSRTGNVALFIGEVRGVPTTADLVTMCGTTVRGRLCGFDRSGDGGKLLVPAATRWEIIRWAKRTGYRWFDFGGLSEQVLADAVDAGVTSSKDWPGPDQAKLRYGGVPFRYPGPVELIRPRLLRQVYDAANGCAWGRAQLRRAQVQLRSRRQPPPPRPTARPQEREGRR
ncbi:GNAT family N-acetyltransferase [Geodermatophilus sabuli]|uniref:GNAT family N-acetyltransferase n=1 Tax=Geodermatophilus sabuli TaxID=1564158 RepID=A0A7K3W2D7_9ACTN|nr:GNAT family N-acetyltransferase [Geodermatophilus sabuli]NEK59051.1 GNAT family N-acetyltransferase [Geodermatophilus sabuli]